MKYQSLQPLASQSTIFGAKLPRYHKVKHRVVMHPILLYEKSRLGMNFTNPLRERRDRVSETLVVPPL